MTDSIAILVFEALAFRCYKKDDDVEDLKSIAVVKIYDNMYLNPACCCSAIHLVMDSQLSRLARSKISFILEAGPPLPLLSVNASDSRWAELDD